MQKSLGLALAVVCAVALAPSASAGPATLEEAAALSGRVFGTTAAANLLGDAEYVTTLDREFAELTPENELKWNATEPSRGKFNFTAAERLLSHAEAQGMTVRGQVLVWHSQLPAWVQNITKPADLLDAVRNHVAGVAGHFSGRLTAWNVVNEAFDDRGLRRNSVFQLRLGDTWVEEAFRAARAADPVAELCYNDYFIEGHGPKSDAVYELVRDFKARGVPIDCVGFQAHLTSGAVPADMAANLQRFADLGVEVHISEMDVAGSGVAQADSYAEVMRACLAVERCTVITVNGVTDKFSWRVSQTPLPIDRAYNKKLAYDAVISVLAGAR